MEYPKPGSSLTSKYFNTTSQLKYYLYLCIFAQISPYSLMYKTNAEKRQMQKCGSTVLPCKRKGMIDKMKKGVSLQQQVMYPNVHRLWRSGRLDPLNLKQYQTIKPQLTRLFKIIILVVCVQLDIH